MHRKDWNTHNEIEFIRFALKKREKKEQIKFIEKYAEALENRDMWNSPETKKHEKPGSTYLNKSEIVAFVDRKMQQLLTKEVKYEYAML